MTFSVDQQFIIDSFRDLVNAPSPVGYSEQVVPVLERYAAMVGQTVTYDQLGTAYITVPGQEASKTVLLSAHLDTLGLMVRCVESDGRLRVRPVGGINFCNLDGEYVAVHTRDGRTYSGLMTCQAHSLHAFFPDARTMARNEDTMVIFLDEDVDGLALEKFGPQFENHPLFPDRVNTEFVNVLPDKSLKMRVWERGSGETLACGTGAAACAAAAIALGYTQRETEVHLPGGTLQIRWDAGEDRLYMTGPAAFVFDGELFD